MGNFGFASFDEAYKYFSEPTHWERNNGVTEVSREVHNLTDTMKLVTIEKSNNTRTIVLFYASMGRWIYWCPTDSDFTALNKVLESYKVVDTMNEAVRWQDAKWQVILK